MWGGGWSHYEEPKQTQLCYKTLSISFAYQILAHSRFPLWTANIYETVSCSNKISFSCIIEMLCNFHWITISQSDLKRTDNSSKEKTLRSQSDPKWKIQKLQNHTIWKYTHDGDLGWVKMCMSCFRRQHWLYSIYIQCHGHP